MCKTKKFSTLILLMVFIPSIVFAQSLGSIKFTNFICDSLNITLVDLEHSRDTLFSGLITNEKMELEHIIEGYQMFSLSITDPCEKRGLSLPVLLENEPIVISFSNIDGWFTVRFSGSRLQQEYQEFLDILTIYQQNAYKLSRRKAKMKVDESESSEHIKDSIELNITAGSEYLINRWRKDLNEKYIYLFLATINDFLETKPNLKDSICLIVSEYNIKSLNKMFCDKRKSEIGMEADSIFNSLSSQLEILHFFRKNEGKYILMELWASWCAPCITDQKTLVSDLKKLEKKNVALFGVAVKDSHPKSKSIRNSTGANWNNIHDPDGEILVRLGLSTIPHYVLFDGDGKLIGIYKELASVYIALEI